MVDIAAMHLKGYAIQWFDWYKHTHVVPTWRQFKSRLLCYFRPSEYDEINGQLAKICQTSIRPSAPSTTSRSPQPKKLLREELRDRSAKGLCWHCDKLWSRNYHCKKERLLMIKPIEHEEGDLEHEENVKEDL
ncbi:hypothetical protein BHM03_00023299 [Ensete ventricosum]|uniref:Retrotransposon gag domain-containing protein n=1 Tax=Ensete ventricosum TaxID=4639 RepID=A0A445MGJ6_ENSVE|nr:hypothetical protein BHM03_00023299 [Ensete ventricosum]